MRSSGFFVFVLFLGAFALGCSSSADAVKTASGQNTNPAKPAVTGQNTESNVGTANSGQSANLRDRRNFGKEKTIDIDPTATPLPLQFHPAGENSETAVTMNGDGSVLEIRVFKSNPQLAKIEATSRGTEEKQVKFYLRNGQVLEVNTDHLGNLQTVTTKELLALAGLK